jgi:hypothetical protein
VADHLRKIIVGKAVQEGEDVFRGDLINRTITEFFDIPIDDGPVGSHRILFSNGFCGNRSRLLLLLKASWHSYFG